MNARRGSQAVRRSVRRSIRRRASKPARGITLLEVLLSCIILASSLAVLAQLSDRAARMAIVGELQSRAAVRCETVLNELRAGLHELPRDPVRFPDDPDWRWSAELNPCETLDLSRLVVTVWREGPYEEASRVEFIRLVPTPNSSSLFRF
jgi:Tfp pilus assembly protein PilV